MITRLCFSAFVVIFLISLTRETPAQTAPQTTPQTKRILKLDSSHFTLSYDATQLTLSQVKEAQRLAEAGWSRCSKLFQSNGIPESLDVPKLAFPGQLGQPHQKIELNLSPSFVGSTAYTITGHLRPNTSAGTAQSRDQRQLAEQPASIHVRYAELDYLGIKADYILTHEIAHVFFRSLVKSNFTLEQSLPDEAYAPVTLEEGISDWAAGNFAGITMKPWWGKALREEGLWIDPDALFVNGNFNNATEMNVLELTGRYTQSALLVQFLVERFGWHKFYRFHIDYSAQRGFLNSNDSRSRHAKAEERRRQRDGQPPSDVTHPLNLAPNAEAVSATFHRHFGLPWTQLRSEWMMQIEQNPLPPLDAKRLVLARRIYGAIREYEIGLRNAGSESSQSVPLPIRSTFVRCNQALHQGQITQAAQYLEQARELIINFTVKKG